MWAYIQSVIEEPQSQRKLVLVIVCIALLLDNMLYMVIVPIIPHYLTNVTNELRNREGYNETTTRDYTVMRNHTLYHHYNHTSHLRFRWLVAENAEPKIGYLFASKAAVQLLVNPISGTIIDRMGYDRPMMFGLSIIFLSTTVFAFGKSYNVMFLARGLQGLGSAFADTSGLAMIADRFTEEAERTKSLGIALAFISFGSLVAPPFGGILYQYFGKELPFMVLALIALIDGCLMIIVMRPVRAERRTQKAIGELPKGTPFHRLIRDPYIATCAGALAMANVSLAFLEPTISIWMQKRLSSSNSEQGLVWLPSFFPHVLGVYSTVYLARRYPKYQWLMAAIGLAMEGISCLFVPFCTDFFTLMIPICLLCYGIALIDTALLPTLAYVVDHRYVSVYGSVYAIADLSYSLAYAVGPVVAGQLVTAIGFTGMNIVIFLTNILYTPVLMVLRNVYKYEGFQPPKEGVEAFTDAGGRGGGGSGGDVGIQAAPTPQYRTYMLNGGEGGAAKPLDTKAPPGLDGGFEANFPDVQQQLPPLPPPPPPRPQQPGWTNRGPLE